MLTVIKPTISKRVPTDLETQGIGFGQGKSGNFTDGQGKFYILSLFFSSCVMIVTFFQPKFGCCLFG